MPKVRYCSAWGANQQLLSIAWQAARNWTPALHTATPWVPAWRRCIWRHAVTSINNPICAALRGGTKPFQPYLSESQATTLQHELAFQNHVQSTFAYTALPKGAVHADAFRNNVMFVDNQLSGVFDFYFAGVDSWLFDLGVCLNDWCIDLASGSFHPENLTAMLQGYEEIRPLASAERALFNPMLRAAALRFWISRLWDFHLPREASLLQAHDPGHFERVLLERLHNPVTL
jgi:homoserine kinase type II